MSDATQSPEQLRSFIDLLSSSRSNALVEIREYVDAWCEGRPYRAKTKQIRRLFETPPAPEPEPEPAPRKRTRRKKAAKAEDEA